MYIHCSFVVQYNYIIRELQCNTIITPIRAKEVCLNAHKNCLKANTGNESDP